MQAFTANRGLSRMTRIAWIGEWKRGNTSGLETSATRPLNCDLWDSGIFGIRDLLFVRMSRIRRKSRITRITRILRGLRWCALFSVVGAVMCRIVLRVSQY